MNATKYHSMLNLKTVIARSNRYYTVSTVDIGPELASSVDYRFETMVFPCSSDGKITDFGELYAKRYAAKTNAMLGHESAVANFQPQE